jgi:hypothetical protein
MEDDTAALLFRIRVLLGIIIAGLVVSGVTAFPLLHEVELLHRWLQATAAPESLKTWIATVHQGLRATYRAYPFMGYGTDWLAFGHLVIAFIFVGAFIDPVRNKWIVYAGQVACVSVIPVALICGEVRGIPLGWRAIDCAFGVFGFIPLWFASRFIRQLESRNSVAPQSAAHK